MACATLRRDRVFLYESRGWLPEIQGTSSRLVKVFQNCESIMVLVIVCIL